MTSARGLLLPLVLFLAACPSTGSMPPVEHGVATEVAAAPKKETRLASQPSSSPVAVRPGFGVLPEALGCRQLAMAPATLRKLPTAKNPVMLTKADSGVDFFLGSRDGKRWRRVVYALDKNKIRWVSFSFGPKAFSSRMPRAFYVEHLGEPEHALSWGLSKAKRQRAAMWRARCLGKHGAKGKKVDVTVFFTPSKHGGLVYVSEGVVSEAWMSVIDLARDAGVTELVGKTPPKDSVAAPKTHETKSSRGTLQRSAIQSVVNRHIGQVTSCYERALLHDAKLGGKLVFEWVIAQTGRVKEVVLIESTVNVSRVAACVSRSIRSWRFPRPKGGYVRVRYPFIFRTSPP